MASKKIQHDAGKGSALTLDEVAAFIQDAMRSGAGGSEIVEVRATWSGKISRLAVDVEQAALGSDVTLDKP